MPRDLTMIDTLTLGPPDLATRPGVPACRPVFAAAAGRGGRAETRGLAANGPAGAANGLGALYGPGVRRV